MDKTIAIAEQAIAFLKSIEGAEKAQGIQAAANLESALSKLAANREAALSELQYGLSAKGVLDWQWSVETLVKLEAFCTEYYSHWAKSRVAT